MRDKKPKEERKIKLITAESDQSGCYSKPYHIIAMGLYIQTTKEIIFPFKLKFARILHCKQTLHGGIELHRYVCAHNTSLVLVDLPGQMKARLNAMKTKSRVHVQDGVHLTGVPLLRNKSIPQVSQPSVTVALQ